MNSLRILITLFTISLIYSCGSKPVIVELNLKNNLNKDRLNETIEINLNQLQKLLSIYSPEQIVLRDENNEQILLSQLVDLDGDGVFDQLIFQSDFKPNEQKHFHIGGIEGEVGVPQPAISTYARFVPERIDDFAWENDKVAFRTYGPTAQAITESGKPGGTLSSGIDCWLKKVDYPIIDKWYRQDLSEGKSYHEDHGEGLDNYHVGPSRGTGGTGIWEDGVLLTSKNYQGWKMIANGPIRTIFELDYGTWDAGNITVNEVKRISIDLGSNLYKNTLLLSNYKELPNITLGVTLHEKIGEVNADEGQGWFRYWEPHEGSELSTAIVVDPSSIMEFIDHRVEEKDLSNILVVCSPKAEFSYYAGFAWKESNQFNLPSGFDNYLADFAQRIASPIVIEIQE